ncbi:HAD-IB family hydrolase, partial [Eggerthella sinensis]
AILAAAEHPRAVSPDRPLSRTAREKGWEILDW